MAVDFRNARYVLTVGYGEKYQIKAGWFRVRIPTPHARGTVGLLLSANTWLSSVIFGVSRWVRAIIQK